MSELVFDALERYLKAQKATGSYAEIKPDDLLALIQRLREAERENQLLEKDVRPVFVRVLKIRAIFFARLQARINELETLVAALAARDRR